MSFMQYSRGKDKFDNAPTQKQAKDFNEFERLILNDKSLEKGQTYICAPLQQSQHHQNPEKYPGIQTWRLRANVGNRKFFALDLDGFDSPETFTELLKLLEKYRGFAYTTASHTPKSPRARVIIELSRDINREEGETLGAIFQDQIEMLFEEGAIQFDPSVYRGEQPIYTPLESSATFQFLGEPLDVDGYLKIQALHSSNSPLSNGIQARFTPPQFVKDGQGRESTILKYAGQLRVDGFSQEEIEATLLAYNKSSIVPPLDEDIVIERARRYAQNDATPTSPISFNWGCPLEIKEALPPVQLFNSRMLPKAICEYAQDISERMSCPIDFPAIALMVTMLSALGSRLHCKPYSKNTWLVPGGAWGVIVGSPSAIKSPPLLEVLSVLKDLDKQSAELYKSALRDYSIKKAIYDQEVKDLIKKKRSPDVLIEPEEPSLNRFIVNDATYETLITIAANNPNGFLIWRDELRGWFHSLEKENQKEARGFFLTGWSGNDSYATDRISRGHVRAENVNISVLGTIQPNVIREVIGNAVHGGGSDDGLIARFQFSTFPDPIRKFEKVDRYPNVTAIQNFYDLVKSLVTLNPEAVGALQTPDGKFYLEFDEQAQLVFDNWRQSLEDRLRDPNIDEHPIMQAHLGKFRSLFPKLALILHLASGGTGAISENSARRALAWVIYLESHARRIYHTATNRALQSAHTLSLKIRAGALSNGFTRSELLMKGWVNLKSADEIGEALIILQDMNWIRSQIKKNTGGRPSEHFEINPNVKQLKRT